MIHFHHVSKRYPQGHDALKTVSFFIDNDEMVIDIARKNLLLNGIKDKNFKVMTGNLTDKVNDKFDLVVANILTETIMSLLDSVKNVLKKNSVFICSGIIEKNKNSL